jgi:hypothetical protein
MGQKGVEIWANRLGLQPVHGKSDTLLVQVNLDVRWEDRSGASGEKGFLTG